MSEVTREVFKENTDFFPIKPMDYGRFLVISLATGARKEEEKYSAEEARKWGILGWMASKGNTPLIDSFIQASGDMVDIHISVVFQALRSGSNYIRVQVSAIAFFITLNKFQTWTCMHACVLIFHLTKEALCWNDRMTHGEEQFLLLTYPQKKT